MNNENSLLVMLQRGIPLTNRPFQDAGGQCGMTGEQVIAQIGTWGNDGHIRRFGGVFDARRLGYRSVLCAVSAPRVAIDATAAGIITNPGVTHCYARGCPAGLEGDFLPGADAPALWFTLAVPADHYERELQDLRNRCHPAPLLALPAVRRFKIDVVFDPARLLRTDKDDADGPLKDIGIPPVAAFSEDEKRLIRLLSQNIPVVPEPFRQLAEDTGFSENILLETLRRWNKAGILRRIALVPNHRQLGFHGNAMCVWQAGNDDAVKEAGKLLSRSPDVTHCYQRPETPAFPYNLYAMLHAASPAHAAELFQHIQNRAGLRDGKLFCSLKEYKKNSMQYFAPVGH